MLMRGLFPEDDGDVSQTLRKARKMIINLYFGQTKRAKVITTVTIRIDKDS